VKKHLLFLQRPNPLVPGILVQRRNRFLADVRLVSGHGSVAKDTVVTAHCPNTGAMEGLTRPGTEVLLDHTPSPTRKLAYTWELARINGRWIGTNTATPNRLVAQLLESGGLKIFGKVRRWASERSIGHGRRTDFVVESGTASAPIWTFLEVKNCHLAYPDGIGYFPDCVSDRAAHHLEALERLLRADLEDIGGLRPFGPADGRETSAAESVPSGLVVRAAVLFVVQVPGVRAIRPSDAHDPTFAEAARRAADNGVEFHAVQVDQDEREIRIGPMMPVDLEPYDPAQMRIWSAEARALKGQTLS
jgi:sugar fermentation stimulation protein A